MRKKGPGRTAWGKHSPAEGTALLAVLALNLVVAKGEFEAAVLGVVVVANGEGDVEGIPGEKIGGLEAFGHMPAEGVEGDVTTPVLSCQLSIFSGGSNV